MILFIENILRELGGTNNDKSLEIIMLYIKKQITKEQAIMELERSNEA